MAHWPKTSFRHAKRHIEPRDDRLSRSSRSYGAAPSMCLAFLISVASCAETIPIPTPHTTFEVVANAGATVDVSVYNYGIPLADADLAGLVKRGIEGQLVREREHKSVRLLSSGVLGGLLQANDARCAIPSTAEVHIVAQSSPASIDTNFTLDQIAGLARKFGDSNSRTPLGFYLGSFNDSVVVSLAHGPRSECTGRVRIDVRLQLTDRHIVVGHELAQQQCSFLAALNHYRKKAVADETTFAQYASALRTTLATISLPLEAIETEGIFYATGKSIVKKMVNDLIEHSVEPLHATRIASQKAVDTPDEMKRLAEACNTPD